MNGMPIWRNWVKFKTNVGSYLTILEASVSHNYKTKTKNVFLQRWSFSSTKLVIKSRKIMLQRILLKTSAVQQSVSNNE